jgi:peptidoglycan hydrolase CwlO-like protein
MKIQKGNSMTEEWPYVSDKDQYVKTLEKDLKKAKNQLYQTLLNANKTVIQNQKLQEQLNQCQAENSKLKSHIDDLNKKIK